MDWLKRVAAEPGGRIERPFAATGERAGRTSATRLRYQRERWIAIGELVAILSDGRARTVHELQAEWRHRFGADYTVESIYQAVSRARAKGYPVLARRRRWMSESGNLVAYALRRPEPADDDWGLL